MKKLNKRPMNEQETGFEMSVAICYCPPCNYKPCTCPQYPTHQIQYDQETLGWTSAADRRAEAAKH